jgi:hypothetical protein
MLCCSFSHPKNQIPSEDNETTTTVNGHKAHSFWLTTTLTLVASIILIKFYKEQWKMTL